MKAPCSWCKRPTSPHDRRYVDRYVTWWICADCYRTTRRAPVRSERVAVVQDARRWRA